MASQCCPKTPSPPRSQIHQPEVFPLEAGDVERLKVLKNPDGTTKGVGFVTFRTEEQADESWILGAMTFGQACCVQLQAVFCIYLYLFYLYLFVCIYIYIRFFTLCRFNLKIALNQSFPCQWCCRDMIASLPWTNRSVSLEKVIVLVRAWPRTEH